MATPRASEHRDLEQRLRTMERQLRELASRALRREKLGVTSGDFTVSGGGGVRVQDGGNVTVEETGRFEAQYGSGTTGLTMGGFDGEADGILVQLLKEDGTSVVLQLFRQVSSAAIPGGKSSFTLLTDDFTVSASNGLNLAGGVGIAGGADIDGTITYTSAPTTGAAANVNYNTTNGNIRVVTSSRRYKQDAEDAPDRADGILSLHGRTWRDRAEVAEHPDTDNRYVGFIAEELHDLGLTEYLVYDDEGRPDAIQYDRLTVPLVQLAKRQQAQLDTQAAQIADLTARLGRLERRA